jgi:hypothetical protein
VFHEFGQAKFADPSWFYFRVEPIYTTAPAASKNDAQFKKNVKIDSKIEVELHNSLIHLKKLQN